MSVDMIVQPAISMVITRQIANQFKENHGASHCWLLVKPLLDYIKNVLCGNDEERYMYVINWMAMLIQEPTKIPGMNLLITGSDYCAEKSIIVNKLQSIIGPFNSMNVNGETDPHELPICPINCMLATITIFNKHFRTDVQRLRKIIDEPFFHVTSKHAEKPVYKIPSMMHCIVIAETSGSQDHDHVLRRMISSRRWLHLSTSNCFAELNANFQAIVEVPPQALAVYLYELDIVGFNSHHVLLTRTPVDDLSTLLSSHLNI